MPEALNKTRKVRRRYRLRYRSTILWSFIASTIPMASAQACIPLSGSTRCPAFNASSISTDATLTSLFPFLTFVDNAQKFDQQLGEYISSAYVQTKYQQLLGCSNVTLTNTTEYYARYTTSVICNSIVQNSIQPCGLSSANSPPLCADSCAQQAISEERITTNNQLCRNPNPSFMTQIRADFTNCALPANSLSGSCLTGEENEPNDCGFATNLVGLCQYCASSSPNATDSCCTGSNVTSRCPGIVLPPTASMPPLFPSSTSSSVPSSTNGTTANTNKDAGSSGLSGGQIAGIVIGSILGAALLLGLLILCCVYVRRRHRGSQRDSVFNRPSPKRGVEPQMIFAPQTTGQQVPVGRVARMAALEGNSSDDPSTGIPATAGGKGRRYGDTSDSDAYGESPESRGGRPVTGKRNGSLSSNSVFGGLDDMASPTSGSGGAFSSPEAVASGQSEQMAAFKDYYSQDEIHPNDKVATLWAYQPRAPDEFELERGDMLKVVGIWDDGWATGVRINERAEDYDGKHKLQRDSGVSNGTGRRDPSPPPMGEIKAFPLVCVCLPEHWKKTVDGDGSTEDEPPFGGNAPP